MNHSYKISGMTCEGCQYKVQHLISQIPGVTKVDVSLAEHSATVEMEKHISDAEITNALGGPTSKYQLENPGVHHHHASAPTDFEEAENRSWLETYKPIVLIFSYITGTVLLIQFLNARFDAMQAMRHFMAGFFLVFSFFKMLHLKGFAESYAMYDVVARKFPAWGYLYAFLELALGVAFVADFFPVLTNWVTLVVMSVSIIGVLRTVLDKKKIQCACLGDVFKLPMSSVTIFEDGLMILMSVGMLVV